VFSKLILYENHFEKVTGDFLLAIQGNPNLGLPEIVNHSDHQQQYKNTFYLPQKHFEQSGWCIFIFGCLHQIDQNSNCGTHH
jgi:hypothetical protein